ncbi:hypothetical protein BpHYR1_052886 [Brachionus plicatilis]|uniref:Uncharacterized protein n=1 Tax=Brachionus plicatilis TaxID=10195 RepID=A0A3M7T3M4_BRAPC|nr:hypothetical protein BpHYR1_052886 [Brachionus plicatilis]
MKKSDNSSIQRNSFRSNKILLRSKKLVMKKTQVFRISNGINRDNTLLNIINKAFFWRDLIIVYLLILTTWVLELKSVAISFQGLSERLRSETEPVSSYRFLVEEPHFGDTPDNLAFSGSFFIPSYNK